MSDSAFVSYKQTNLSEERFDAIIIGSGIGGLGAAAMLARHGRRVLVLERHYTAGGFTHVFRRPGYEWDVGVHYIGQAHIQGTPVQRMFDYVSEGRLRWHPMPEVYDRVFMGGETYEFQSGEEPFRDGLAQSFPTAKRAIGEYLRLVRGCVAAQQLYFAEKALPGPVAALAGGWMRRRFLRMAGRTTREMLATVTQNRTLAAVLTAQWPDYGLPPRNSSFGAHATIAEHYLDGACYPVGGAGEIARSIAPAITQAGGQILVCAEVERILTREGRAAGVRMADGRELLAPLVISDAGARNTYQRLITDASPALERARNEIAAIEPSCAHVCLYVGLDRSAEELGLDPANLWIYPNPDHDGNMERFLQDPRAPLPAVYISFPSAKDPTFVQRFPGRATIEVIMPASFAWFRQWSDTRWKHRASEYEEVKARLAERLLGVLQAHVPAVRGRIRHAELSTPLSTAHFTAHPSGEIYGLAHTPARFRLRLGPRTPLAGLYLTGQDVAMAGVTGALAGAALCVSSILRRNVFDEIAAVPARAAA